MAEWVGVVRLCGPADKRISVAWGRGIRKLEIAVLRICLCGVHTTIGHPSDGIGGWVWFWIRLWLGGVASDVGDGHVASDFADGETSEGSVVGISGACYFDILRV